MYSPVDRPDKDVNVIAELVWPPGGGVIGCGTFATMSVGALPTHETENVTGELNPWNESTITVVPVLSPGLRDSVSVVGLIEKSGSGPTYEGVTGARTGGVPAITTEIWVE